MLGSSFDTSKRLDIAPLCQFEPAFTLLPCFDIVSEVGITAFPAPAMYIAALPFPGRIEGRRLTITAVERGII